MIAITQFSKREPHNPELYKARFIMSSGKLLTIDLYPVLLYFEKYIEDPIKVNEQTNKVLTQLLEEIRKTDIGTGVENTMLLIAKNSNISAE